ncbi:MAG: hypothetical protein QXD46_08780 [Thermofilum sp.]
MEYRYGVKMVEGKNAAVDASRNLAARDVLTARRVVCFNADRVLNHAAPSSRREFGEDLAFSFKHLFGNLSRACFRVELRAFKPAELSSRGSSSPALKVPR